MDDNGQKGFIIYGDMKEVVDELSNDKAGQLLKGMLHYFVDGTDPEFSNELKFVFIPIRQQMDRNADKYAKTSERNRQNAKKRWDAVAYGRIRSDAVAANKDKDTDKDIKERTDTVTESSDQNDGIPSLLSYFNSKTGSSYNETDQFDDLIQNRLSEGYTFDDLRAVIDKKAAEWSCDGKMRSYLRPSTLFGDKFEEYLNAPIPIEVLDEKKHKQDSEQLQEELNENQKALKAVTNRMDEIQNENSVKENFDEWTGLKLEKEICEQQIRSITERLEAG